MPDLGALAPGGLALVEAPEDAGWRSVAGPTEAVLIAGPSGALLADASGIALPSFLAVSSRRLACSMAALSAMVWRNGSSIAKDALIIAKKAPRPKPRTPDKTALVTHDSMAIDV